MGKNDLFQQGLLQQKEGLPAFICLIISVQLPVNLMVFVPLPMGALVTHCQSKQFSLNCWYNTVHSKRRADFSLWGMSWNFLNKMQTLYERLWSEIYITLQQERKQSGQMLKIEVAFAPYIQSTKQRTFPHSYSSAPFPQRERVKTSLNSHMKMYLLNPSPDLTIRLTSLPSNGVWVCQSTPNYSTILNCVE